MNYTTCYLVTTVMVAMCTEKKSPIKKESKAGLNMNYEWKTTDTYPIFIHMTA